MNVFVGIHQKIPAKVLASCQTLHFLTKTFNNPSFNFKRTQHILMLQ
jgi:hypothetical protein